MPKECFIPLQISESFVRTVLKQIIKTFPRKTSNQFGIRQEKEYKTKVENGDAFIVVIERAGCSYCIQYMPIIEAVADEKNIPLYYIDTDKYLQKEKGEIK